MKNNFLLLLSAFLFFYTITSAQTNILSTSAEAEKIMTGDYNPLAYQSSVVINDPSSVVSGAMDEVSVDSLKSYLTQLSTFQNRNTGSDTSSGTTGIGAARRWAYSMFQKFSTQNENRLIPSYLQFNQTICSEGQHKNIFAVLPGADTSDKSNIIIEAHIDSRCKDVCDALCTAHGMEDNGSGSALVLELARVLSKYTFQNTLIFLLTIGEEQGLMGAEAFAAYVSAKNIQVKAVQNNDIVGGIICGATSSPPSCSFENHIDSTQVRIFSYLKLYSIHKGFARWVKVQYQDEIIPFTDVPMAVSLMEKEDRDGRGGDHIPFRYKNIPSIRFTSANEHGNANSSDTSYHDRQHTEDDILGVDTNNDGAIDSFFVDFNYLKRNTIINGVSAAMLASGPKTPGVSFTNTASGIAVSITDQTQYLHYKVGIRTAYNDFDYICWFKDSLNYDIQGIKKDSIYYISVASVDSNGTESLFTKEQKYTALGDGPIYVYIENNKAEISKNIQMLQNKPNPYSKSTVIPIMVNNNFNVNVAYLLISDMLGKKVAKINLTLKQGLNHFRYTNDNLMSGIYNCCLVVNGQSIQTEKMVVTR